MSMSRFPLTLRPESRICPHNRNGEHYQMIRQRKRPNAKEAKTLKVMGEFKRSGFGSWKTSGIAASHRFASYLSDPREARRIAANIAKRSALLDTRIHDFTP